MTKFYLRDALFNIYEPQVLPDGTGQIRDQAMECSPLLMSKWRKAPAFEVFTEHEGKVDGYLAIHQTCARVGELLPQPELTFWHSMDVNNLHVYIQLLETTIESLFMLGFQRLKISTPINSKQRATAIKYGMVASEGMCQIPLSDAPAIYSCSR